MSPFPLPLTPADETITSSGGLFAIYSYAILEPLAATDATHGYPLRALCRAVGSMFSQVEVVRAQEGADAWRKPFDSKRCPNFLLPFLGLFVGEQVDPLAPEAAKRQQIEEEGNFHRGRPSAMISAVSRTLTGAKRVRFIERSGGAWKQLVVTYPAETPSPTNTATAAQLAKPGGIILTVEQSSLPLIDEGTKTIDAVAAGVTIDNAKLTDI